MAWCNTAACPLLMHRIYCSFALSHRLTCRELRSSKPTLIARFMGPTWGPPGADRTQVGLMLAPWSLLSGQWLTKSVVLCYMPTNDLIVNFQMLSVYLVFQYHVLILTASFCVSNSKLLYIEVGQLNQELTCLEFILFLFRWNILLIHCYFRQDNLDGSMQNVVTPVHQQWSYHSLAPSPRPDEVSK